MPKNQLIYLTGFMGAGKSTIGPILANTLGWDFLDVDKHIEDIEKKKVNEIFAEKGESYFRNLEAEILRKYSKYQNLVISLGGGTIAFNDNLPLIKGTGFLIYLESSIETIRKRLLHKRDRPMLKIDIDKDFDPEELFKTIDGIFKKREHYYLQADYTIKTDGIKIGRVVDQIANQINKYFNL